MSKGKINVHTENIFPIIKKFLYSDHEIFLRELVSNAADASLKLKTLANSGEFKTELGDLSITVAVDKDARTITISDSGIGMNAEEIDKYINQIAFSGAEEFVEKYKDKMESQNIIGHFGLGFYSSFMVSSKVEIISRSWKSKDEADAVKWVCDGSPEFELGTASRKAIGTDIVLHINDDSLEYLEPTRISNLLDKYCKFLPVPVNFEGKKINNTSPAWVKKPSELTEEDYLNFYKELYPFAEPPLFHIHLNVDFPFNLSGILYFPKFNPNVEFQKNKILLFSNQVFVTDSVEGIVPDFLTLLHGVIDSPDIPLNVSRSYLQSDSNVKKISSHISKKVADKLEELFKEDRSSFESKWDDIGVFIKYGMLTDEKFYDRTFKFCLLKSESDKYFTINEYEDLVSPNQTNKDGKIVFLYAADQQEYFQQIESCKNLGYDALILSGPLESHFINQIESKNDKIIFARVDSNTPEKLIEKEKDLDSKLSDDEKKVIDTTIEAVKSDQEFKIEYISLPANSAPLTISRPEFMRRFKEMSASSGNPMMGSMPDPLTLSVNTNHPLIIKAISEPEDVKRQERVKHALDLALLSQNMLKGKELSEFIKRSLVIAEHEL